MQGHDIQPTCARPARKEMEPGEGAGGKGILKVAGVASRHVWLELTAVTDEEVGMFSSD